MKKQNSGVLIEGIRFSVTLQIFMLKMNFEAGLFAFSISENTSEQTLRATDIMLALMHP